MKHVVEHSKAAYAGSTHEHNFVIFHDALSQWWEPSAQEFMRSLGFQHRQVKCIGATNAGRPRYANKLVGNSPELCRALDSHGFADLKNAIDVNRALTCAVFPVGDARRFEMGTPSAVFSTMSRCWQVAPSSARVMEDIKALPRVIEKIIAYKGCCVPDEFLRDGRRRYKKNGEEAKKKARSRQRKETVQSAPLHPHAEEARRIFVERAAAGAVARP